MSSFRFAKKAATVVFASATRNGLQVAVFKKSGERCSGKGSKYLLGGVACASALYGIKCGMDNAVELFSRCSPEKEVTKRKSVEPSFDVIDAFDRLNKVVEQIKSDQQRLEHKLDFVRGQQSELEELLRPLEASLQSAPVPERKRTYNLAETLDAQLQRMADDLREAIGHLNTDNKAGAEADTGAAADRVVQIGRVINAHAKADAKEGEKEIDRMVVEETPKETAKSDAKNGDHKEESNARVAANGDTMNGDHKKESNGYTAVEIGEAKEGEEEASNGREETNGKSSHEKLANKR